jgi:hypothetical protein
MPARAQSAPDTLRGTVRTDSGAVIIGAEVIVTRAPDRAFLRDTTDANGHYQIIFADGTGDYLVHAAATGFTSARKRVTRAATERVLTVDFNLPSAIQKLAAVTVSTSIPKPSRGEERETETGESGKYSNDGVSAVLLPDQLGDLAATGLAIPGVFATPGGPSVLGLGSDQNSTTLNGMAFAGSSVPRDMTTRIKTSTSTYDPSRGWFGGAQTNVEIASGTGFAYRRVSLDGDPSILQYVDRTGERLGQRIGRISAGGAASGMLGADVFAYNVGVQASRRVSDAFGLESSDSDLLQRAGLSRDSVNRFLSLASSAGVPLHLAGDSRTRSVEDVSIVARFDHKPYDFNTFKEARQSWQILAQAALSRNSAVGFSPTGEVGHGGSSSLGSATLQGVFSTFWRRNFLTSLRSAISVKRDRADPYLLVPEGRVLVSSILPDASLGSSQVAFGGNGSLLRNSRRWTWESTEETQFYIPHHTAHRIKTNANSRVDGFFDDRSGNRLGSYSYNSLADFAANQPAYYSRTLTTPAIRGNEWNGYVSVGDFWRKSRTFQLLFGARLEGNRFLTSPARNPDVERVFEVRTDQVPASMHVSPRFGFTWIRQEKGNGYMSNQLGQFNVGTRSYIKGGFGEFRSFLQPDLLAGPLSLTGLPGGALSVACIGSSVPRPDWAAFAAGTQAPNQCVNGASSVFADSIPAVQLFGKQYSVPRSWRGNLSYASTYKKLNYSVEGIYSLNLDQPGRTNLNFTNVPQFVLAAESRPVFVRPADIVAATGAVSPVSSRRSPAFASVVENNSRLRSVSRQLLFSATPDLPNSYALSFAYTLAFNRGVRSGFDGPTFESPLATHWVRGDFDSRHQVTISAGHVIGIVGVTAFLRLQSGFPFTPVVSSDVNGDGYSNDRAFVFDPSAPGTNAALAASNALMSSSTGRVQSCLRRQLGHPGAINSCEGPWTAALNLEASFGRTIPRTKRYGSFAISVVNGLGGLDQLLHGSNHLKGWGTTPFADPVLYNVRGFDPATKQFRYEVNPGFGNTSPARSTVRAPFRISLSVSVNLGPAINLQMVSRYLRPGRAGMPGKKLTAPELLTRYRRNVNDPYAQILEEKDSLLLTPDQETELRKTQDEYSARMDSLWKPFADYLANLPDQFDVTEVVKRQEELTDAAWEITRLEVQRTLPKILTKIQLSLLPGTARALYNATKPVHMRTYYFN